MSCNPPISLRNALSQADAIAPGRHTDPESDGICADARHIAQGTSDHIPDSRGVPHAVDVDDDPFAGFYAHQWAETLRLRCASGELVDLIEYIISDHRITSAIHGWEWAGYSGSDPHVSHIHISIKYTSFAENWTGQWWVTADNGGFGTMDDAAITGLFEDQSTQNDARFKALNQRMTELENQANHQNKMARERQNAIMKHLGIPLIHDDK